MAQSEVLTTRKRNFSLTETRYDQRTILGRLRHFLNFTNPSTLFVSKKELEEMRTKLDKFQKGTLEDSVTDEELWRAKTVTSNTFARDGEKIPWPFRMSGYALGNLPVTVGLMLPNASLPVVVFFQWLNQTQNALTNHYNRSGESVLSTRKIMESYLGAVGAAVSIAVGSKLAINRVSNESLRGTLNRFVPFVSVATANVLNTYLMRRHETETGIRVYTKGGETVGNSKIAAKRAIAATCFSRAFMSFTLLAFPPWIYYYLENTKFLKANPKYHLPMQFAVVSVLIFTVIPMSVALFSQEVEISSDKLEPEFKQKYPNTTLLYNKGL